MPELPEVENIKNNLLDIVVNNHITATNVRCQKLRYPVTANLDKTIRHQSVINIRRRGKFLLIDLSNGYSIIIHLGMSGKLLLQHSNSEIAKHDHIIINLSNQQKLVLNDARRFGMIDIVDTSQAYEHVWLSKIGIEPLLSSFDASYLYKLLNKKSIPIKIAIMNSTIIAGVGNIYANESLFKAKINPLQICSKLSILQLDDLVHNIKDTLLQAIKLGGSSVHSFVNLHGNKGNFQNYFSVYNRAELDCIDCGNQIVNTKLSGRSTFFCSNCQKL